MKFVECPSCDGPMVAGTMTWTYRQVGVTARAVVPIYRCDCGEEVVPTGACTAVERLVAEDVSARGRAPVWVRRVMETDVDPDDMARVEVIEIDVS